MTDAKVRTRVKQVDALSFTIGVAFSYVAQFVFLMRPDLFPYLYMLSMAILLPHRYFYTEDLNNLLTYMRVFVFMVVRGVCQYYRLDRNEPHTVKIC